MRREETAAGRLRVPRRGGYIFGLPLKERLLALEHETPLLVGCTSTRILCVHGCAHKRRIRPD